MDNATDWESKVKGILKAELKRRDISYQQLAEKLAIIGVAESAENIANKDIIMSNQQPATSNQQPFRKKYRSA